MLKQCKIFWQNNSIIFAWCIFVLLQQTITDVRYMEVSEYNPKILRSYKSLYLPRSAATVEWERSVLIYLNSAFNATIVAYYYFSRSMNVPLIWVYQFKYTVRKNVK